MIDKTIMNPFKGSGTLHANSLDHVIRKIDGDSILEVIRNYFRPQPEVTQELLIDLSSEYNEMLMACDEEFYDPDWEKSDSDVVQSFNYTLRFEEFKRVYSLSRSQMEQIQTLLAVIEGVEDPEFFCEAETVLTKIRAFETAFIKAEDKPNQAFVSVAAASILENAVEYWEDVAYNPKNQWNEYIRTQGRDPEKLDWNAILICTLKGAITGNVIFNHARGGAISATAAATVELVSQL